ncbi:MAG TPA: glycoside hydrolase family 5 protein [Fimbriimonas sp.]
MPPLRTTFTIMMITALGALGAAQTISKPLAFTGVNLAGAEFGPHRPGEAPIFGQDYEYPHENEVLYFASKGMNVFRIPFRWEAMQRKMGGELVPEELARLRKAVAAVTDKGLVAILDPHNYARYDGKVLGGGDIGAKDFAFFWSRLAKEFKADSNVWFGLMNEPHDLPSKDWLDAANAAIAAIRAAGAKNLILVPGNHWSGAHSWGWSDNATVMLEVRDPIERYAFDVHQYLDKDSSGTSKEIVSPTIGVERLRAMTDWCRKHKRRAFLGEFGTSASEEARVAVQNMLRSMEANRDVWLGFAWWAAGPRWGDYMYSIEPKNLIDRPQLEYLRPHLQRTRMSPLPIAKD